MVQLPVEKNKRRRGHRFYPTSAVLDKVPKLYAGDKTPVGDKIIYVHYFSPSADWYLTELDHDQDEWIGFGWANLGDDQNAEWGYVNLVELEAVYAHPFGLVERDTHWTPKPAREVLPEHAVR